MTGATVERNVSLKVGTVAESITVSGESPMVDTRSAAVASTTTREVIENLPIIRTTVTDYVQATPGVSASSPGAYNEQIQVMGSPSNETTYVHDGVVINHVRTGNTWQGADIDSVEEINTVALGASAEWQSTAGGVVNVVTKSGTNKYEGDFTAYWKSNTLQSQSIKVERAIARTARPASTWGRCATSRSISGGRSRETICGSTPAFNTTRSPMRRLGRFRPSSRPASGTGCRSRGRGR